MKVEAYISEIKFNDGKSLTIKKDDIVVFVGPNNVGKSRALKDLFDLSREEVPTTVIESIKVKKPTKESLTRLLEESSVVEDMGSYKTYQGHEYRLASYHVNAVSESYSFGEIRNVFISYLNTETRLQITNPPNLIA